MIRRQPFAVRFAVIGVLAMGGVDALAQGAPPTTPDASPPSPDAAPPENPELSPDSSGPAPAEPDPASGAVPPPVEPSPSPASSSTPDTPATRPGEAAGDHAGAPAEPSAAEPSVEPSLIEEDVDPTVTVFRSQEVLVRIGGLVQVHFAPWVGADSLLSNGDIATEAGFRLRRTRFAVEGHFHEHLRVVVEINPLESDPEVGTVADASISYQAAPWLRLQVGTDKVPFTRAELESSSETLTIENPLTVRTLLPERRLGLTAEGELLDRRLAYLVAFMNGTEGYDAGNRFGGYLYAGRLQFLVVGNTAVRPGNGLGVAVGVGGLFEDGPATHGLALSADVLVTMDRAIAKVEGLCDRITPQDSPIISPGVADSIDRCGAYVELGYTLPMWSLQPVVRAELFDDDRAVEDAGDAILLSAGVNVSYHRHARWQLHYLHRRERFSNERQNDALILSMQGEL